MVLTSTEYNTLQGEPLQGFYTVVIHRDHDRDRAEVEFRSRGHVNGTARPTFCWSTMFTDREILCDPNLIRWVTRRYGNVWRSGC